MRKQDVLFLSIVSVLFLLMFGAVSLWDSMQSTGELYAKVFYKDELILMIDLHTNEYVIYNTPYKNQINVGLASEGVFYVPGTTTQSMEMLYLVDNYAKDNQVIGIKLLVENQKIRIAYQESPRDLCELQSPTDSRLRPLVCLPNELTVSVFTNMNADEFIPDAILE